MKFLYLPFILLLEFTTSILWAQTTAIPPTLRASMTMNRISSLKGGSGNILYGIPLPPGKVIGDSYLNKNWNQGSVLLYESETLIEGFPLRFDIEKNELEINTKSGAKVLAGNKIKSFTWQDSVSKEIVYYVNAKDYNNEDGTQVYGFLEVLSDGAIPALKKTTLVIKKANYVKEFDTGTRDDQILKKDVFYYAQGNKIYSIPMSKKKILPLFNSQAEKMKSFIDVNDMNLKEAHHIKSIFDYYNSLVKG